MKLVMACIVTCAFLSSSRLYAGSVKEIYTSVQEEIELYYQASGDWSVLKVSDMEFVPDQTQQYLIISAAATIRNVHTGIGSKETCLVTFTKEENSFYSIICF